MSGKISSQKPLDERVIPARIFNWILINLVFLLALGASLFLAVGKIDWQPGWIYLGMISAGQIATTLLLLPTNPALLGERAWMQKGSKLWDRMIVSLLDVGWFATMITAGLDARFAWSPRITIGFSIAGWVLLGLGYLIFLWAMASNRFFSSFVRLQADRGHRVESGGPYRYVRHPGYIGCLLISIAGPLALASLWSLLPAILMLCLTVFRTALEDRTLQAELEGYAGYALRVRYRLLPGIW